MAFGLGILRLPPRDLWAMTLPELSSAARGALGLEPGATPFDTHSLRGLMARFPDKTELF